MPRGTKKTGKCPTCGKPWAGASKAKPAGGKGGGLSASAGSGGGGPGGRGAGKGIAGRSGPSK